MSKIKHIDNLTPGISPPSKTEQLFQKLFLPISLFILLVMLYVSTINGINGDDIFQVDYSEKLINYYTSFGQDKAALNIEKGKMHYYGGFFEILAGGINRLLGLETYNPTYHTIRHLLIALFGFFAIFFTGKLAKEIAGWRAGVFTLVLLFLSPRFFGHAMMNPKDIPFATGFAIGLYHLFVLLKKMPKPQWKNILGLGLGVGIATGVRAGGLLLPAYALFIGAVHFLTTYGIKGIGKNFRTGLIYIAYLVGASILGYIFAIIFWPAALQSPLKFPLEALAEFSKIGTRLRVLFQGDNIMSDATPWYYGPLWMLKTIPLFTIIGILGSLFFIPSWSKKYSATGITLIFFAALFPVLYVIYKDSSLHDGWRHLIFEYPPMVIIASLFWIEIQNLLSAKKMGQQFAYGLLAVLMINPTLFIARNIHQPYIFFNPIGGGIKGAFGDYETDYWGVSVRPALKWMEQQGILSDNMKDTVIIGTTFHFNTSHQLPLSYRKHVKVVYVRFNERYKKDWDYGIFPSRFFRSAHLKSGHWPNSKSIHTIMANGSVPICAIEKNEEKFATQGEAAMKAKNFPLAIEYFNKEAAKYPDNELAWLGLLQAYTNSGNAQKALSAGKKLLEVAPMNEMGLLYSGLAYLNTGQTDKSEQTFKKGLEVNPKNSFASYYLALIYEKNNRTEEALKYALQAIKNNNRLKGAYEIAARAYQKQGDNQRAAQYQNAAAKL